MDKKHDIIVIGASAGGIEAVEGLLGFLPSNLPAAIFVVIHIPPDNPSSLPKIFQRSTKLKVQQGISDGEPIRNGWVYVAPPDLHLTIEKNRVRLARGPKENRHRPSVDVLFRSAALACGTRVIGVILTGTLDDGTAGLSAIKACGGTTVVQDPNDAEFREMPGNALDQVKPDHVAPLQDMGALLTRLARNPEKKSTPCPTSTRLRLETAIAEMKKSNNQMEHLGNPSVFACPECHGVLWELKEGKMRRFRCRVGHAFSMQSLKAEMTHSLEEALWSAVRSLEEKTALLRRLADEMRERGHKTASRRFADHAGELVPAAKAIRAILVKPDR